LAGNCQKHGERLWRRPMRGLPGWVGVVSEYSGEDPCMAIPGGGFGQRIMSLVTRQDRSGGRSVPLSPSAPPQKGDTPSTQCPGVPSLQMVSLTHPLKRPSGSIANHCPPLEGGCGQRKTFSGNLAIVEHAAGKRWSFFITQIVDMMAIPYPNSCRDPIYICAVESVYL